MNDHERAQRATRAYDALVEAHRIIRDADNDGELSDVLDHIGRLARQARETVRMGTATSRR